MSNVFSSPDDQRQAEMASNHLSTWAGLRRFANELEVQMHLARMEMRDRWHVLEPRLTALEHVLARSGNAIRGLLRKLRR